MRPVGGVEIPDSIEVTTAMIDSVLSISDDEMNASDRNDPCTPERRQILRVESFSVNYATYQDTAGKPIKYNRSILLVGKPTPSSCSLLVRAYIHFVPEGGKFRTTTFNKCV